MIRRSVALWWLYIAVLVAAALFIAHSFVRILVLGLFGYYATRPICARFETTLESDRLAPVLTVLIVLVPLLLLVVYVGFRVFQQLRRLLDEGTLAMLTERLGGLEALEGIEEVTPTSLLRNPPTLDQVTGVLTGDAVQQGMAALDAAFGALMLVSLAVTLSYALLAYDEAIATAALGLAGGRDTTAYAYARAVDADLQSVFFGNFLFVLVMAVIATVAYAVTNLLAPPGLRVPMAFTLGVLTGVASLIPLVVGKVVYLPVVAYLGGRAAQQGEGFVFVGVVLVAYFLVLDILPQSFVQPYVSGRRMNALVLLFAYILGPMLFGWYGFFLLPIVFVLLFEAVRVVLPELLDGDVTPSDPAPPDPAPPHPDPESTPGRVDDDYPDGADD